MESISSHTKEFGGKNNDIYIILSVIVKKVSVSNDTSINLYREYTSRLGFPGGSVDKNLPAMQEMQVPCLVWEDDLEKEMATHCSILARRIFMD